jgi:hypothetical protein
VPNAGAVIFSVEPRYFAIRLGLEGLMLGATASRLSCNNSSSFNVKARWGRCRGLDPDLPDGARLFCLQSPS